MSCPVLIIGNDIHFPPNEMASVLARDIAKHFQLPREQFISLQSRKPIGANCGETVIAGSSAWFSRLLQMLQLVQIILRSPKRSSEIIHFIGNGKPALRLLLTALARLTQRKLLCSHFGRAPLRHFGVTISVLHENCIPLGGTVTQYPIVPPWTTFQRRAAPKDSEKLKLIFASVPAKAEELDERGIAFLVNALPKLLAKLPEAQLCILNRYPWVSEALKERFREFAEAVEIRDGFVADMNVALGAGALLVIPYGAPHLPQIPLSAVEALASGSPCIVDARLALSDVLATSGAGLSFSDEAGFIQGVLSIRSAYDQFSRAAVRCAEEQYNLSKNLTRLKEIYSRLTKFEILLDRAKIPSTDEAYHSNTLL